MADRPFGEQHVAGEGHRRAKREEHAEAVERDPVPEVDDERQADRARARARPTAAAARAPSSRTARTARPGAPRGTGSGARRRSPAGGWRGSRRAGRARRRRRRRRRGRAAPAGSSGVAAGGSASRIRASPIRAPVQRTWVSRSDERPDSRITFETVPFSANSVPAPSAIAYPIAGWRSRTTLSAGMIRDVAHGFGTLSAYTEPRAGRSSAWSERLPLGARGRPFESGRPDSLGSRRLSPSPLLSCPASTPRPADPAVDAGADDRRLLASAAARCRSPISGSSRSPTAASTAATTREADRQQGRRRRARRGVPAAVRRPVPDPADGARRPLRRRRLPLDRGRQHVGVQLPQWRPAPRTGRITPTAARSTSTRSRIRTSAAGGARTGRVRRSWTVRVTGPGLAYAGGVLVDAFRAVGWGWGGSWSGESGTTSTSRWNGR